MNAPAASQKSLAVGIPLAGTGIGLGGFCTCPLSADTVARWRFEEGAVDGPLQSGGATFVGTAFAVIA